MGQNAIIGTGTVQRVVMEQPRPFDVDVADAAFASQSVTTSGEFIRATPLSEDPQSTDLSLNTRRAR